MLHRAARKERRSAGPTTANGDLADVSQFRSFPVADRCTLEIGALHLAMSRGGGMVAGANRELLFLSRTLGEVCAIFLFHDLLLRGRVP